jgi:hypothetical protein
MKRILKEIGETVLGFGAIALLYWVLWQGACIAYVH